MVFHTFYIRRVECQINKTDTHKLHTKHAYIHTYVHNKTDIHIYTHTHTHTPVSDLTLASGYYFEVHRGRINKIHSPYDN